MFKEFQFSFVHEADHARGEPSLLRIAIEVFDSPETDFGVELCLQLPTHNVRKQHFVIKTADPNGGAGFVQTNQ